MTETARPSFWQAVRMIRYARLGGASLEEQEELAKIYDRGLWRDLLRQAQKSSAAEREPS